MLELNPVVYGDRQPIPLIDIAPQFQTAYKQYLDSRSRLYLLEDSTDNSDPQIPDVLDEAIHHKSIMTDLVVDTYKQSPDYECFQDWVKTLMDGLCSPNTPTTELSTLLQDEYLHPLSSKRIDWPSPIESIWATTENMQLILNFRRILWRHQSNALLSGAHAWGPFFAIKGRSNWIDPLRKPGVVRQRPSDIDLLITYPTHEDLETTIEDLVENRFLDPSEKERLDLFKELKNTQDVGIFSTRSLFGGVEQSIHFVPWDVLEGICTLSQLRSQTYSGIEVVRDFRPNLPGNLLEWGGYPTGDLKGLRNAMFKPSLQSIQDTRGRDLGYLSETPIGGCAIIDNQQTYFIGVLSFFLLIAPTLIIDSQGEFSKILTNYRQKVAEILMNERPKFIPRQERMPKATLERIRDSLCER